MIDTDKKTVLVVDEHGDEGKCPLALLKERLSHELVHVRSSDEALDYLYGRGAYKGRDNRRAPELVLVGLRMRRAADLAFVRKLRADPVLQYLVIVFLAASKKDAERAQAGKIIPDLCLLKPSTPAQLGSLAERLQRLLS